MNRPAFTLYILGEISKNYRKPFKNYLYWHITCKTFHYRKICHYVTREICVGRAGVINTRPGVNTTRPGFITPGRALLTPARALFTPGRASLTPGQALIPPGFTFLTPGK